MAQIHIEVLPVVPADARQLIWMEFFQSRGRGVSLAVHSPWIDAPDGSYSVVARETRGGAPLGALVVKLRELGDGRRVGMIGYVCVVTERRGRGLSRVMVDCAIKMGRARELEALILWSQTPQVYRSNGFEVHDNDVFRQYGSTKSFGHFDELRIENWPGEDVQLRGVPAFARGARRISNERAAIVVLDTLSGPSIAEWTGADTDVANLIGTSFDGSWWLNAFAFDGLLSELGARSVEVLQAHPSSMMVCPLRGDPASIPGVRLLDRI